MPRPTRLRSLCIIATSLVAAWLCCWQLWIGAAWWVALAVALRRRRGPWTWLGVGLAGLPAAACSLVRYPARVDALSRKVVASGPDALSIPDCLAVWGLNLVMAAAGAALGFPEVAAETVALAVPGRAEATWPAVGGFPGCVPAVRRAIDRGGDPHVGWTYASADSFRGALALNPASVTVQRAGGEREVRVTVPVDYPLRGRLRFARLGPVDLVVEVLFYALEQRGWLHPFQLTWQWTEPVDTRPPPRCEAWSVRTVQALPRAAETLSVRGASQAPPR